MPKQHWSGAQVDDGDRLAEGGLGPVAYADAVATYLGFAVAKATTRSCSLTIWEPGMGRLAGALGRQALPMQWAYAETNPLAGAGGDIEGTAISVAENLDRLGFGIPVQIRPLAAQNNNFPGHVAITTDPPYYDNIGYADLSDFFYVWHRRTLSRIHPDLFRRVLTPKDQELIAAPYRDRRVCLIPEAEWNVLSPADRAEAFFMHEMKKALAAIAEVTLELPTTLFYAFRQSDVATEGVTSAGWATFLQAIVDNWLSVDGTWPARTEATNALKKDVNALASSIILVCRHSDPSAPTITRANAAVTAT
jgi:putative DNA methylase